MLAGLAAQTITVGVTQTLWAFGTTILVFAGLLLAAAVTVSTLSLDTLGSIRMAGPVVKRWSGYVLLIVGTWFIVLATIADPVLGR